MASATWGRNMSPYWVLDSPYSLLSVKMVLAAGNVTKTMPCTSPAALMIVRSVFEAIWSSRRLGPQVSPLGPIARYRSLPARAGRCHPPRRMRRHGRRSHPSRSPGTGRSPGCARGPPASYGSRENIEAAS
jgi:hypothetical protein